MKRKEYDLFRSGFSATIHVMRSNADAAVVVFNMTDIIFHPYILMDVLRTCHRFNSIGLALQLVLKKKKTTCRLHPYTRNEVQNIVLRDFTKY